MPRYGFSHDSVVVFYRAKLVSAKTALRELGLESLDSSFLRHFMTRPAIQAITTTGHREHDLLVELVESQLLSRKTAMGKLGIENPDQEWEDILMERMLERPEVQTFILQAAQQFARAKYPWRFRA